MDLRSLATFIQVAESNSFTRAAEKLGYSQPTVSFQIKQLELELGVQLFDRIGHTVCLTDEGRNALAYAQRICHISQEMAAGSGLVREPAGIVRIAMADSLCVPLIAETMAAFRKLHPNIFLHVTTAGTAELFRLLDHNEADIVCTLDSHIYNTTYIISNEEKVGVHFVCSRAHPLADIPAPRLSSLLEQSFLLTEKNMSYRRLLDEQLARMSIELRPVLEIGSTNLICRLAEENVGIAFLPDFVTEEAVRAKRLVRLQVPELNIELWKQILYHRDKWMSLQMKVTLDYLAGIPLEHK